MIERRKRDRETERQRESREKPRNQPLGTRKNIAIDPVESLQPSATGIPNYRVPKSTQDNAK